MPRVGRVREERLGEPRTGSPRAIRSSSSSPTGPTTSMRATIVQRERLAGTLRRGAVLAGPRGARRRASSPSGCSATACRYGSSCRCTSSSGIRRRAASDGRRCFTLRANQPTIAPHAARGRPAQRGPRLLHRGRGRQTGRVRAVCALSFRYGQRHTVEIEAASACRPSARRRQAPRARPRPVGHWRFRADASDIEVPQGSRRSTRPTFPSTYVPARNTIFLSVALGWAEVLGASDIFIGVNALDYSGYPDCRPEFIQRLRALARAGHPGRHRRPSPAVHTPLHRPVQGRHHPARDWSSASTTA